MKRKESLPELLAPAGSYAALVAAINAGADAVYVGAPTFNARIYAENFTDESLRRGITYAHLHGRRVYVALNTLVDDREIPDALAVAAHVREAGADAVIVADLGMASLLQKYFPDLPLHASTQASVHSSDGANAMATLGFTRVVPARELSLPDIRRMVEETETEIEVFLHGALCVSHSGQCLFSALVGGRSGNRGACAQPCRLPYNGERYPLSLRDLSLADHIPALIESGVASLKIEGRMKSPEYVYGVTRIYRRLLDEHRAATQEENARLRALFSRSGFTDGYFCGKTDGMTGVRTDADKEASRDAMPADVTEHSLPLTAKIDIIKNENVKLTLHLGNKVATAYGQIPSPALTAPLDISQVRERLAKMGGTFFTLAEKDIAVRLDEKLNLPPSELNRLRRTAVAALLPPQRQPIEYRYETQPAVKEPPATPIALCLTEEQLMALPTDGSFLRFLPLFTLSEPSAAALPDGVYLPPVVLDSERSAVEAALKTAAARGIRFALVSGVGQITLARHCGMIPVGDFRLNIRNREARAVYRGLGVDRVVLSPELSLPKCRDIGGYTFVYGRIPLMLLERCFIKENFGCQSCNRAALVDRRGARFPLVRVYPHRNLLLNALPTYMGDKKSELSAARVSAYFFFSVENGDEVRRILQFYRSGNALPYPVRRVGVDEKKPDLRDSGRASSEEKKSKPLQVKAKGAPKKNKSDVRCAHRIQRK